MAASNSGHDSPAHDPHAEAMAKRAAKATEAARALAARLASTAEDLADTLDEVAQSRDERTGAVQFPGDDDAAQRARDKAEGERRDARELREKWDVT
ncbi:hypothetical protein ACFPK1_13570 [Actinomycetospora rhizophila]|uniref:Uncharacterized protein n=1 Tax=Actinomycetospora rhizophila TaxID=1416876 RepID=A0ABV9ZCH8_9PSEU